jgi:hypothetical protein
MSNEFDWYKKQDECRQLNNTARLPKSDVLACVEFGGGCSMVACHTRHSTPLPEPRNRFYAGESDHVEYIEDEI